MILEFEVPGKPVAQSRPRFARAGKHVIAYDGVKSKDYKSWVKTCAVQAMQQKGAKIVSRDMPLTLVVCVWVPRPKRITNKLKRPVTKPDIDNYLKGIMDAMEGIVYEADQQVVSVSVYKHYAVEEPKTIIQIMEEI